MSLSALVQGFIFSLQVDGRERSTVDYYQGNLRRFLWYASNHNWPHDPQAIDSSKLREFLAYAGNAENRWGTSGNGSENCREPSKTGGWRYYRSLRRFFNWAVSEGFLEKTPLSNIKPKPPKEKLIEPYTPEETRKLVAVCDYDFENGASFLGARNKAVILLYLDSGARFSEVANLRLADLNLERGRAKVLRKGGDEGVIGFGASTKKALWKYLTLREERARDSGRAGDWLWLTEEGTRLTADGLNIAFRRIKKRAGINRPGAIHKLRHTWAITTLRQVKDPFLLQLLLGHKDLTMTRRYTQGLKLEEALTALDKASPVDRLVLG